MLGFLTFVSKMLEIRRSSFLLFILYASAVLPAPTNTRPSYHITPEKKWMSDPQRPFFLGDEWHLYYLYNSNFDSSNPGSGGTEWYHITSTDMVHWTRRGVVMEKYKPNPPSGTIIGDIETGSAVVDVNNTAGFGRNAVVAIVTQMTDGVQQQSLFYSTDNGYSFIPYQGNPVMPNPSPSSKPAFRDPKIFWDDKEGHLKTWSYVSEFKPGNAGVDLGTLECPDLYQIDLDGDSTKRTWILAIGANGYRYNKTTGTAYWTGNWGGNGFAATESFPQWMDDGPDFYATVGWENPDNRYGSRYAIAWMNNWEYAASLPYYADFAGQQSLVREVKLKTINGSPTLVSIPIEGYEEIIGSSNDMEQGAYIIRATISKNDGDEGNEVRFVIKSDGTFSTTVGYDFVHSQAFLVRDLDGSATDSMAAGPKQVYDTVRTAPLGGSTVKLHIYVD
ncbi:Levanbiose-producing levanase [Fusarium phyllophilum]|uniref:Levanbiose-producing levanase n=1 Tax=Fusarium phyllophilum TaxID=47803 RepID=A0A8H5IYA2_9HYPO|nr:Levanbiose-producing levanase [Fusarium phyllophilum]